jgi:chromosome segregation ATPase
MDATSPFSNEQISALLQTFFQNIVTKEDLKHFATREDILELQQNQALGAAGVEVSRPPSQTFDHLRQKISENQTAIDALYQELTNNKQLLGMLNSEIKSLRQEISFVNGSVKEIRENLTRMQIENQMIQTENSELLHNLDANTRVIGKMAAVVTDLSAKIEQTVTKDEIKLLRNEMIERLDGIIRRFEIFEQEQVSLKSAMKRMEKIQHEEAQRNDSQDATLKIQQEKLTQIEQKISKVG